jgi:SP family arabinose:H+ symporter-like MFS transporter
MTSTGQAEPNVLAALDQRPATAFYWRLTLLSTLGGFLFGYDTSNIGSALNFIPYSLNGFAQGYLVAGKVASTVAGVEVTAIMTAVNVLATYLAFRFIDHIGRRKLAVSGFAGMLISAMVSAGGLALLSGTTRIVVVAIGLDAFIASFAAGVGGTGWLIQGEVFPTAVRGQAAAIAAAVDWIANFALIEVFPTWESGVGLAWVMVSFAALCAIAIVFVLRFLPETKGHSVEEIIALFEPTTHQRESPS